MGNGAVIVPPDDLWLGLIAENEQGVRKNPYGRPAARLILLFFAHLSCFVNITTLIDDKYSMSMVPVIVLSAYCVFQHVFHL
jgi:hypothetical protein